MLHFYDLKMEEGNELDEQKSSPHFQASWFREPLKVGNEANSEK